MLGGLLENGNKRIGKLIILKLGWGTVTVILIQVLGMLPSLDFLDPKTLKLISFGLGVLLTSSKAIEMFFDKTIQMLKNHEIPSGDTEVITKQQ